MINKIAESLEALYIYIYIRTIYTKWNFVFQTTIIFTNWVKTACSTRVLLLDNKSFIYNAKKTLDY